MDKLHKKMTTKRDWKSADKLLNIEYLQALLCAVQTLATPIMFHLPAVMKSVTFYTESYTSITVIVVHAQTREFMTSPSTMFEQRLPPANT